jgi:hypothetical protein
MILDVIRIGRVVSPRVHDSRHAKAFMEDIDDPRGLETLHLQPRDLHPIAPPIQACDIISPTVSEYLSLLRVLVHAKDFLPWPPAIRLSCSFILYEVIRTAQAKYVLGRIPVLRNANKARDREIDGRDVDAIEETGGIGTWCRLVEKWQRFL